MSLETDTISLLIGCLLTKDETSQDSHSLDTEGRDSKVQEEKGGEESSEEKCMAAKNLFLNTLRHRDTRTFENHLCPGLA